MRKTQAYRFVACLMLILVGIPAYLTTSSLAPTTTQHALAAGGSSDWSSYLYDPTHSNDNVNESTLSVSNVSQLQKLWTAPIGGTIEASAIVSNGTVYIGSWNGYEYALNEATGAVEWKTFLGQTTTPKGYAPCNPPYSDTEGVNSSPTILNGVAYLSGGDSNFYALDITNGNILWSVFEDSSPGHEPFSSPLIANGYAYIGLASNGDCPLVQGAILQISLSTHQVVNRFNVVSDIGGGVWGSIAYDAATNTLFFDTGNEDNNVQYSDSIVSLNASTLTPENTWQIPNIDNFGDADFGASPTLFTDSGGRTLVGVVNKDGYFYALDRSTFQLVWSYEVSDNPCGTPYDGCGSISSAAFANDTIYVAGGNTTINGNPCAGSLRALDADNGNLIWQYCEPGVVMGGVTYANGILAVGAGNTLEVHNATTGALLYSYQESTNSNVWLSASPVIANGQIFEGYGGDPAAGGTLFDFGLSSGTPTPSGTPPTSTTTATPTNTPTVTSTPSASPPTSTTTATPTVTSTPGSAPAFVQVTSAEPQTNQTTVTVTYPSAQHGGDTNILAIGWNDTTSSISAVTDSAGNTYQVAAALSRGSGLSQAIYYAKNITAAPANGNTVTITFNKSAAYVDVRALEYSGLDPNAPFDVAASASGSAATADSGPAAIASANELLIGAGMTTGIFTGAGNSYTARLITSPDDDIAEDQPVSAVGTYHATAAVSGAWLMQLAAFKAAGGGTPTVTPTLTATVTSTSVPSSTTTATPTLSATPIPPTATASNTALPSSTSTATTTLTATTTRTATTPLPTATATASNTALPSSTTTATPTLTTTPPLPTATATGTPTQTALNTATPTPTSTGTTALTPIYVQGNSADPQVPQSTVTVSYTQAQAAGDLNVVVVGWNDTTATISSVVDSAGNSYQVAVPMGQTTGLRQAIYYAKNIGAASTNTVTVTFSQAASYPDIRILEYGNVNTTSPFDVGSTGTGTAATANSGSATTTAASDLLVGAGTTAGGFSAAGSGYTNRMITTPDADLVEDQVATAAGSHAATATVSGAWIMQLAAFKAAGGGTPTVTPSLTATPTPAVNTATVTSTSVPSSTGTATPTLSATPIPPTATATASNTPLPSSTATATPTLTTTPPLPTATGTASNTALPANTATATTTPTATPPLPTATATASNTPLPSSTTTATTTPTATPPLPTATATASNTALPSSTATATTTLTATPPLPTATATGTPTKTATRTATPSPTSTATGALTPIYVQGNSADPQVPQSTVTVSYTHAQAVGDINIVVVGWNDTTATINSVVDSAGNSYQVAVPMGQTTGLRQAIYYAKNIGAASTNTVTVTFSQAASYPDIRILEYGNVNTTSPFDVGSTGSGTAATANSGSATTTAAPDLLVGAGMTSGTFSAAGSGYTKRMITAPDGDIVEDQVAATSGSHAATAAVSGVWLMQLAAFKPGP